MNTNEEIVSPLPHKNDDNLIDKPASPDWPDWPVWLDEKLEMAAAFTAFTRADAPAAPPESRERCRQRAVAALAQAKLRAEHEQREETFIPLGLTEYLWELAESTQVVLAPVLASLGLAELGQPQIATARALGQLARTAGLSLLETLTQLRISIARRCGLQDDLQALMMRQRSQRFNRNLFQEYVAALTQLEKSLPATCWQELQQIEQEIRAAYEENND
jgi:hypothetical protein